ncbi:uncharacterized protein EAE97_006204 [Botrytis byssoidea]|uniref:linoleate 8R-lipoxygenase n=1 Tax=Botrytis byssoidea TaxID=139641 RepID=A0A9P5IIR2_9HELO|nr:uncharacterized protein EAE97_006204 [Botrytis byssoidea]KAF7942750.1 hypothetical protein EAE97_006204 [Botrytis byssoidea]
MSSRDEGNLNMEGVNAGNGVDDKKFVKEKNKLGSKYRNYFTGKFQGKSRKGEKLDQKRPQKGNTRSNSEPIPTPAPTLESRSELPSELPSEPTLVPTSQSQAQPQSQPKTITTVTVMPPKSSTSQPRWTSDIPKTTPTVVSDIESATHSIHSIFHDLKTITPEDANTLLQLFSSQIKGVQNDNTLLLEKTVKLLASQPEDSQIGKSLTASFVNTLWDALPHPPVRSLDKKFMYRDADGGNNNILMPDLGKAGTAYAKSVKPERMRKKNLPDPGELFDGLMRRGGLDGEEAFKGSPTGISSQLFYLATIIIHDLFLTDHEDMTKSKTSSYLDLAPLYGCNQEEQNAVRTFEDGKLKPDCFSSKRILGFPPGVGVFLIMFNRFHNHVVGMLAQINDNGRFTRPKAEAAKSAFDKYDNDLFQTGRLITCGLYVNIVLKDYVRTILNLNRTTSKWDLDPRVSETKTLLNKPAAEGVGNQVTAEFNLIYRWHSAISQRDEKWTNAEYARLFPNKNPADVTLPELLRGLHSMEAELPTDPSQRSFADLNRLSNGSYDDESLVSIFSSSVEDLSGAFGATNVPPIMRSIEILSILQSRSWNMCTLNEFRSFVGLSRHTSFADINPDPVIAKRLKEFYGSPDDVEFYPGVVVEKIKPPVVPGSGLCTGYSISYSILSDAVGLVRGDRFYTTDYTPESLTNWGYNEVQFDTNIDDGAVLYKLVLRAFPNHFQGNSIYAHFPFVTPETNREIQKDLGRENLYSWDKPKKKADLPKVEGWEECRKILDDKANWKVTWGAPIAVLTSQSPSDSTKTTGPPKIPPFCLAGDESINTTSRSLIISSFHDLPTGHGNKNDKEHPDWQSSIAQFYTDNTADLFDKHKVLVPTPSAYSNTNGNGSAARNGAVAPRRTYRVDVVSDICNRVFTRFAAGVFDFPLKLGMGNTVDVNVTTDVEDGYTEEELYTALSTGFICIFNNFDVTKSFVVNQEARAVAKRLGDILMEHTNGGGIGGVVEGLKDRLHSLVHDDETERLAEEKVEKEKARLALKGYGKSMLQRFVDKGKKAGWGVERVVWEQILPTSAAMTANQSQLLSQVLDYYLSDAGSSHLPKLYTIAHETSNESDDLLLHYFLEAARLRGTVALFRLYSPSQTPSQTTTTSHAPGTVVLLNLPLAHHDPVAFPNPETVVLDRNLDSYLMFGHGPHECLGRDIALAGMVRVFRIIVGLKNLRLDAGSSGYSRKSTGGESRGMKTVETEFGMAYLDDELATLGPFPKGLRVCWDE